MAFELLPLKPDQHTITFVPRLSLELPFFNLTFRKKDVPRVIKYAGRDGAGRPMRWEVYQDTSSEIGPPAVEAHEVWYLLVKPSIDSQRQQDGSIPEIIPLGGIRECLRKVGWSAGGFQARELIKALTQIAFAGCVADLWIPTGDKDQEGKEKFLQIKGRFSHAQRAGKGTYDPWELKREGVDNTAVIPRHHYLRIEVPKWFVNNQSNFLHDRIVSGIVEIKIGEESYNAVLGTFPLSGDNRVSPVFNRALLDNRVYNGGSLTMKVFIKGIRKDTAMGGLLKSLADTALNVAVGQVATMTGLGAVPALNDASKSLAAGVKETLNKGESQYGIFEENGGFEPTFNPGKMATLGNEIFWVAYRGNPLTGKQVKVVSDGQGSYDVHVDGNPLRQGAWVLLRISRESTYGSSRPWTARAEQARNDLTRLMQDWKVGAKTLEDVKQELAPTLKGSRMADRILALRPVIDSDTVLSSTEQGLEISKLVALLEIAQTATNKPKGYDDYFAEVKTLQDALLGGTVPVSAVAKTVFQEQFKLLETKAASEIHEEFLNSLVGNSTGDLAYSEADSTNDVSLMTAQMQARKNTLKTHLSNNAQAVSKAVSLTESELWKRLGEIEQERRAKRQ